MKNIIATIVLALCCVGLHAQTSGTITIGQGQPAGLVLAPTPPAPLPHASATVNESQFDAMASVPPLATGKTSADVASEVLNGFTLTIQYKTVGGISLAERVTLTPTQKAAYFAVAPQFAALGKDVADVKQSSLYRVPNGQALYILFTK